MYNDNIVFIKNSNNDNNDDCNSNENINKDNKNVDKENINSDGNVNYISNCNDSQGDIEKDIKDSSNKNSSLKDSYDKYSINKDSNKKESINELSNNKNYDKTNKKSNLKNDNNNVSKSTINRRNRINRIKTIIVLIVIILLILPTICCVILGLQVSRLQNQVNNLATLHSQYNTTDNSNKQIYAYAAVKPADQANDLDTILEPTKAVESNDSNSQTQDSATQAKTDISKKQKDADAKNKNNEDDKKVSSNENTGIYADKKVYLTFDDGPSKYTGDILDLLSDYNIKATFFVIGKTDQASKELYKRIVNEGHTLGMHSYSHKYDKIYNSVEDFDKDFTKLWKLLYDTTGYKPSIYRFPGGSDNLVNDNGMKEFIRYLNKSSIVYYDWNVVNGDATSVTYTEDQLVDNVLDGVAIMDTSIVLMHDTQTKQTTVDSLPELIEALISGGAKILPLDKDVPPIQMIKADTVK
ncbi:MAG: polysaccharide deacetylase [Herbinix sp.]|nr:polysaccharide deacetylase [Herbinix sp.]